MGQLTTAKHGEHGSVRTESRADGEELVVPVVMMVPGVRNNAWVPSEELQAAAAAWNGTPVPVGTHPNDQVNMLSAQTEEVQQHQNVGRMENCRFEQGKLKGDARINVARARELGFGDYIDRLKNGEQFEVSVGYFTDPEETSGELNGHSYGEIHRNLKPDHLAILADERGACSTDDGCGAPRTNRDDQKWIEKLMERLGWRSPEPATAAQEMAHNKLESELNALLMQESPRRNAHVIDVLADNTFVYKADMFGGDAESDPFRMFRRGYSIEDGTVQLGPIGEAVEVRPREETDYIPVGQSERTGDMDRQTAIEQIIASSETSFTANDRQRLQAMHDNELKALSGCGCGSGNGGAPQPAAHASTEQLINSDPDLYGMKRQSQREKQRVISRLTSEGSGCQLDKDQLQAMTLDQLTGLEDSLSGADYSGQGGSGKQPPKTQGEDGPPEPPSVMSAENFDAKGKPKQPAAS